MNSEMTDRQIAYSRINESDDVETQCSFCGFPITLNPKYDDMTRDQCFDCSARQLEYEREFD